MKPQELRAFIPKGGLVEVQAQDANDDVSIFDGQIFPMGEYTDPRDFFGDGDALNIDERYLNNLKANFDNRVIGGAVQVPFGDHDRDVSKSVGEVVEVRVDTTNKDEDRRGLWGRFEIDDPAVANKIRRGRAGSISPLWRTDYVSSKRPGGKKQSGMGPTLIHAALIDVGHFAEMANLEPAKAQSIVDEQKSCGILLASNLKKEDSSMDNITKEQIDALTDDQLEALGVQKIASDEAGDESEETTDETQTTEEGDETKPEDKETEGEDDEEETEGEDEETSAQSTQLNELKAQQAELRASNAQLHARNASLELEATCKSFVAKAVMSKRQRDSILKDSAAEFAKAESADDVTRIQDKYVDVLGYIAQQHPHVRLGQQSSGKAPKIEDEDGDVKASSKTLEKFGVTPEMQEAAKAWRKDHGKAMTKTVASGGEDN